MEGFCRGCLIKYDEPMELLQYTEKNRRLFVYSTGLQVKRNDSFMFQLCRDCFVNMKQACKFKKNCRNSDKRFRNYVALKDEGDPVDFCTFLKNNDDTLTFRFPMTSGNSTPATQKCREDDNESTCTSIRNFMTDILQGEEMPDTEARIIKEVIEEEADLLDDSLDSHWLQDDMSIDTDFRLDFSFSAFSTPRSVNNDPCYTPKQKEEEITFNTINTEKQTKILNDFTNAFKTNDNIEELSIFVGDVRAIEKTEHFENLKELSPFGIDEIDSIAKSEIDTLKNKQNLNQLGKLYIDEINGMETSDSQILESNQNLEECDFGLEEIDSNNETENNTLESNHNLKELSNFGAEEFDGIEYEESNNAVKSNNSLKEIISISHIEEIDRNEKFETDAVKTNQTPNELLSHFGLGTFGKSDLKSNQNLKELCESLDGFNGEEKAESKTHKKVQSLKELCDFNLDSIGSLEKPACNVNKNNESLKELYNFSLNSFDDTTKSGRGSNTSNSKPDQNVKELDLSLTDFDDMANSGQTFKNDSNVKEMCDFGIKGTEKSESNFDLPSLPDVLERDKMDTPDFDIPKGVIGYMPSSNDISNSSINMETFLKDKPCTIDTNLEDALKNNDSEQFLLEDLLVSPQVFPAESAVSTPTISNILFGAKHDTKYSNTKMEQCIEFPAESAASTPSITNILFRTTHTNSNIEPYHDIQEDIEIFEEFFQNDTKEFNLEDIIRENGGLKSEDWKKSIAVNDVEVNNKENESKNMDIFIEDTDVTESKKDLIYISHTSPNDKFNIEYLYCKLCKIRYDTSRALSSHLTKFHKIKIEKPKTRNCDKTKPKKGHNIPEIPSNDKFDMKNFYCKLCERKYDSSRALSVHFSKTHNIKIEKPKHTRTRKCDMSDTPGTESNNEAIVNILDTSPNDKFNIEKSYCKLCKKKYNDGRALSIHMSIIHNIKIVKPGYDRKNRNEQLCNNCGMEWKDSSNFARHVKICQQSKGNIFKCEQCLQEFKTKFYLEKHKIAHTNVKSKKAMGKEVECTLCGAIVRGKFNYTLHMRRHTKDYIVNCKYCDKGFYRQSDLKIHMRKHTGDTPFSCTFCTKVFARRDVLLRHIHTHLGKKFFECDSCGLKCIKKTDLINHIQNKSCRRVKKPKKKKKTSKLENMEIVKQEHEIFEVEKVVEVHKKVKKIITANKKIKSDKKENFVIDITDERGEKVEVKKPKVTVIYAKGSDATFRKQFAFLEPEIKPQGLEEKVKVEVKKPKVVIYAKGSQPPFLETEIIPQKQEVQKVVRKIKTAKKKNKTDKKENMYIDLTEEQEEKIEAVIYAKGSDEIRKQLPWFGTKIMPQEQEKVEVQKEVTFIYPKGGDAKISQQLPFLETDTSN